MTFIDTSRIYVAGYSLGATIALFTTALDPRVKGAAVVSAFSSLRTDNKLTEGVRHYSHLHGLLPRLGFFVGHEARIPIDFDDILAGIAPRPLLVIAATNDYDHSISSVQEIVSNVSPLYKVKDTANNLTFQQPHTYNHLPESLQQSVAEWLRKQKE
jgi:pimeloyl-ACP methyl ester carboxylesterase